MRQFLFVCTALAIMTGGCASTSATNPAAPRKVTLVCDGGQNIGVSFSDGRAILETANTSVALVQQPSGSGISYAGGGHQLRGKGADMTWTDAAGTVHNCRDQNMSLQQPQIQEPSLNLAGTTWRLVHFLSSDDTIGKVIPPNVGSYTLQFMADGTLAMQLDCNRGNASWKVKDMTPTGASLTISPVAMTRAMCEPGAIDSKLARDMGFVRTYTMAGGNLHMALEADSGIYVWEPVPPPAP